MTAAKREELLTGKEGGIGFSNAYHRLRLIKNLIFTLETELNKGTKITIFIGKE